MSYDIEDFGGPIDEYFIKISQKLRICPKGIFYRPLILYRQVVDYIY